MNVTHKLTKWINENTKINNSNENKFLRIIGNEGTGKTYWVFECLKNVNCSYVYYNEPFNQSILMDIINKSKFMSIETMLFPNISPLKCIIIDNYDIFLSLVQFKKILEYSSKIISPIIFISSNPYAYKRKCILTINNPDLSINKIIKIIQSKCNESNNSISINLIKQIIKTNNRNIIKTIADTTILITHKLKYNKKTKIDIKKYKKLHNLFFRDIQLKFTKDKVNYLRNKNISIEDKIGRVTIHTTKYTHKNYLNYIKELPSNEDSNKKELNELKKIERISKYLSDSQVFMDHAFYNSEWVFVNYGSIVGTLPFFCLE